MSGNEARRVPVLRPKLPSTAALVPYLQRIDASRTYTNHGPLVAELEDRLAATAGDATFVTASNGTMAIAGAILATAGWATPERVLAIVPGFTFVASAIAARLCGYRPYFVDVDANGALQADALRAHQALARAGVVIPVAPFGRPVTQAPWERFARESGTPVVIDAAASFDFLERDAAGLTGAIPVAISTHATKSFSTGEGGGVLVTDATLAARVTQALNFGFYANRSSATPSVNGKLSEYHAAVGLAELDGRGGKRADLDRTIGYYRAAASDEGIGDALLAWPDVARCYVMLRAPSGSARAALEHAMDAAGFETRSWYGDGAHAHPEFAGCERDALPATEALGATLLAVPSAPDIPEATVRAIVRVAAHVLREGSVTA